MTLNSKQKLLVAVVALGGVAVGVDRFVLGGSGGPASAAAATAAGEDAGPGALERKAAELTPRSAGASARSGGAAQAGGEDRVRARLASLRGRCGGSAEMFVVPASWGVVAPAGADQPPARAEPARGPDRPEFRMTMVVRRSGAAVAAVINGRTVSVGEMIDGYRLVALSGGRGAGSGGAMAAEGVLEGPGGVVRVALDPMAGDR